MYVCSGHESYRDGQRPDHSMHDSPSPASRERSSSLQGMDMASLPPRKRPWHDGPGTGDMDSPGAVPDDRGAGEGQISDNDLFTCKMHNTAFCLLTLSNSP